MEINQNQRPSQQAFKGRIKKENKSHAVRNTALAGGAIGGAYFANEFDKHFRREPKLLRSMLKKPDEEFKDEYLNSKKLQYYARRNYGDIDSYSPKKLKAFVKGCLTHECPAERPVTKLLIVAGIVIGALVGAIVGKIIKTVRAKHNQGN